MYHEVAVHEDLIVGVEGAVHLQRNVRPRVYRGTLLIRSTHLLPPEPSKPPVGDRYLTYSMRFRSGGGMVQGSGIREGRGGSLPLIGGRVMALVSNETHGISLVRLMALVSTTPINLR